MSKNLFTIIVDVVLVVVAFTLGWYAHALHMSQSQQTFEAAAPAASSSASVKPATKAATAPVSESTSLYSVTPQGATKLVASSKLQVSFSVPSMWVVGANAADSGINLAPPSSVAVMTIYGATDKAYIDPTFIDGTSEGFVAMLGLPDGKEVDIGKSAYSKLKTASVDGHDAALVVEPNGDQVTWVHYDALNWYVVEKADIGASGRAASQILTSIKLK